MLFRIIYMRSNFQSGPSGSNSNINVLSATPLRYQYFVKIDDVITSYNQNMLNSLVKKIEKRIKKRVSRVTFLLVNSVTQRDAMVTTW